MTSEIRTNSLKSRAGMSTVTMTDSGPMFSGITTFVDNSGFTFGVGGGTSIFTPATNVLTFGTNNTEKIRIDASGHMHGVGVITATHFYGDGSNLTGITETTINNNADDRVITGSGTANTLNGEQRLTFNSSNILTATETGTGNGMGGIRAATANAGGNAGYGFMTNNANRFAVTTIGSEGSESLRIYDDNNNAERLRIISTGEVGINVTPSNGQMLAITGRSGYDDIVQITAVGTNMGARINLTNTGNGVSRINATNNSLALQTGGNERLRITSDGDVLINQPAEAAGRLGIKGTNSNGSTCYAVTNSGKALEGIDLNCTTVGDGNYGGAISFGCGGNGRSAIAAVQSGSDDDVNGLAFFTHESNNGSNNAVEKLRIDPIGDTTTKGSTFDNFVHKTVQSYNGNDSVVQYILIAPTNTNNIRLKGQFQFSRAAGTSGIAQQIVDAMLMTNHANGDAQYHVSTKTTDQGSYPGIVFRWVTCVYNSTTYYALESQSLGSSYWGAFMQHGFYKGTANACTNLGTVLNTASHTVSSVTSLETNRKSRVRYGNTSMDIMYGGLYVKQGSGIQGGYFAPTYYDTNGAALPTQMKVHGQKAVCIDCTRYYTSGDIITFRINNDYEGAIYVNPSGVQYNSTSDYRLKENVIELTGAIDRVKQLKPKRFNFIKDPDNTMDGFMAHEVSSVVPNAVVGEKDAVKDILYEENDEVIPEGKKIGDVKEKDAIDPQSMDDSKLVPLLTAALQEAITKIETFESKVETLEQENIALRVRVTNLEGE